jgi:hypothetical protein
VLLLTRANQSHDVSIKVDVVWSSHSSAMSVNVGSPKSSQLNAHPSDVVPIQRDVAVAVPIIQLSTDTASSGSNLKQPCDVVSTVCDVVTTLYPLDVTNADHTSSTMQAHHCNPHGEFSNMETTRSLNHSIVVTPNKSGEQHGSQFACVDATGLFSCAVSCATYRFRFLLGDMVWNEVLSYIKVPSCCVPARTKSTRCLLDTMIIHRKAIMPAMEVAPAVTRRLINGETLWTDVNLTSAANPVLCSLFQPYCALCNMLGWKKYSTAAMDAGEL